MANSKSKEFREAVAEQFIQGLKEDGLNWKSGWKSDVPVNGITDRPYRGVNKFSLFLTAWKKGYSDDRWLTFKQIRDNDYHLQKGAKGAKVEYWFPYDNLARRSLSWKEYREAIQAGGSPEDYSLFCRMYTVFNGDQIEGLPEKERFRNPEVSPAEIIEKISRSMGVPVIEDQKARAFYRPGTDEVHLPPREYFYSSEDFNAVALHELGHATGAEHRLNREQSSLFGSIGYAYEELVAEITSAYMGVHTGIAADDSGIMENHKAYVNSWIEVIEKSPEVLMSALKEADAASDLLEYHAGLLPEEELRLSLSRRSVEKVAEKSLLPEEEKPEEKSKEKKKEKDKENGLEL